MTVPDFYDLFRKEPERTPLAAVPDVPIERASSYAAAALRSECEQVANAANGTRNDTLNRAYFRMGRHIGAGSIDLGTVRENLASAARASGLPDTEIDTVLRDDSTSAATAGQQHPRHPDPLPDVPGVTVLNDTDPVAPVETAPLNPIIDWHELFSSAAEEEEWVLEPLLPARRMVALYSAPKAGKSLLMLELAVGIATGTEVIGVTPDKPRRVLYVDFENDPRGDVLTRLEAMEATPEMLGNLCYLTFPSLAKFDTAQGAIDLMRHVAGYDCEVVVIDTVSRAVMGEENENDTWLAFYRHTGLALKRAEVACIRLDHSGKDREKGMRGGSAKYGDVDAVWRLTALNDATIQLECTDHRMPVPVKSMTLTREDFPLRHRPLSNEWQVVADARATAVDEVLDVLGVSHQASVREAKKALRQAGQKAPNNAIEAAVKARKLRVDLPLMSSPRDTTGHLGTAGEVSPGTAPPRGTSGTPRERPAGHPLEPSSDDPDELVACEGCHRPTTRAVFDRNEGQCATCARSSKKSRETNE